MKDSGQLVNPNTSRHDSASSGSYYWPGSREPQEELSLARDLNATESGDLLPEAGLQDTVGASGMKGAGDDLLAGGQLTSGQAGEYDMQLGQNSYQGTE